MNMPDDSLEIEYWNDAGYYYRVRGYGSTFRNFMNNFMFTSSCLCGDIDLPEGFINFTFIDYNDHDRLVTHYGDYMSLNRDRNTIWE